MNRTIENNNLKVTVSDNGAELVSVWDKKRNVERIWRGDAAVWGRHAPVLFPFVGKVAEGKYSYKGREYKMTSHGFARDREFDFVGIDEDNMSVTHVLRWSEKSLAIYPFKFALYVKHNFADKNSSSVNVEWKVVNEDEQTMLYGIGGHPAFTFPEGVRVTDCSLRIQNKMGEVTNTLKYHLLDTAGCIDMSEQHEMTMDNGCMPITENMFDKDALIVLDNQINRIALLDEKGSEYVSIDCAGFPYFGIWSKKVDEFICLEPWYGIADVAGHDGNLEKKAGMQPLAAGDCREYKYTINF